MLFEIEVVKGKEEKAVESVLNCGENFKLAMKLYPKNRQKIEENVVLLVFSVSADKIEELYRKVFDNNITIHARHYELEFVEHPSDNPYAYYADEQIEEELWIEELKNK